MDALRIRAVCGLAAVFGVAVSEPAGAVVGPAQVSIRTVRAGNSTEASVAFTVANGEMVPAAAIEGSERFEILDDDCEGTPPAGRCKIRLRFTSTRAGPVTGRLRVGDAVVRLNAAAYGVGPSLEASPSLLAWDAGPSAEGPVDAVRSIRVVNRGDEPLRVQRVSIAGRDSAAFSVVSTECTNRRLKPDERCETLVRLRSAGGSRRAELRVATELPQAPYSVPLRTAATTAPQPERPLCPCATNPNPPMPNAAAWSFGIVSARFARRVVTEVYTSLAAKLTVTVFRGRTAVKSTSTRGRVTGRNGVELRVSLKRGGYRVRVIARRSGDSRTTWKALTVG
ncbi:MAG TPA: hypothetical protein VFZ00_33390 [Solirubrobacter sp.]|jgi:hypothetical protein|nr:hypothetical protein [Solirubrobacter sp.]